MTVKPISPDEVVAAKTNTLPDEVIAVWNGLIAASWDGHRAHIKQGDAITALMDRTDESRLYVIRHWLDIENVYRAQGWEVEYDKPGYNESYEASFTFRRKR